MFTLSHSLSLFFGFNTWQFSLYWVLSFLKKLLPNNFSRYLLPILLTFWKNLNRLTDWHSLLLFAVILGLSL
jgi:hypothetical protein